MYDFLSHFYRRGTRPFRSLTALPEAQAISIMKSLYIEGSVVWERFEDPAGYLAFRKQVEINIRKEFIAKGGRPKDSCPIYLVVGKPKWFSDVADPASLATIEEIEVPLKLLDPCQLSFTYPDSMVSAAIAEEKNPEVYEPNYHGKVFTLDGIIEIVAQKGMPDEGWHTKAPKHLAHYIEAQFWDHAVLEEFYRQRQRAWPFQG
jgi:hypothetical protein